MAATVLACCLLAGCGGMVEVDTDQPEVVRPSVAPPRAEPTRPAEPEWRPLFNGTDLTGW
ncbi:unnamed protein product, partial [marine sediment metagenome]